MPDGAIHYDFYLLQLTMAVDNSVSRMSKGAFYCLDTSHSWFICVCVSHCICVCDIARRMMNG